MTTTIYDDLDTVNDELVKCMKCGMCMAVCPVYLTEKQEAGVARGKIALAEAILKGQLDLDDKDVVEKLFDCLVCTSCMQNCPCGVKMSAIVPALRAAIVRKKGLHPVKKMIFGALKRRNLLNSAMRVGATFQWMGLKKLPDSEAYSPRFPIGLSLKRVLPGLASSPFRDQVPEVIEARPGKVKVAYFTGCAANYMYPQIGHDVLTVLKENQVEVIVPKEQQCCGVVVFAHGDVESARFLARRNLDVFEKTGVDYIVTACGTCGESWQHGFKELLAEDPIYATKAAHWSGRTHDISTFLLKVLKGYKAPQGVVEATVTFHDSCHLKKVMKVFAEPREILKSIPGVTLKEMAKPDACCGSGGSYTLTHEETSMGITGRKIADINNSGADEVVTGCPACMMQLSEGSIRFGRGQKIAHFISLLARSYREAKKGKGEDIEIAV